MGRGPGGRGSRRPRPRSAVPSGRLIAPVRRSLINQSVGHCPAGARCGASPTSSASRDIRRRPDTRSLGPAVRESRNLAWQAGRRPVPPPAACGCPAHGDPTAAGSRGHQVPRPPAPTAAALRHWAATRRAPPSPPPGSTRRPAAPSRPPTACAPSNGPPRCGPVRRTIRGPRSPARSRWPATARRPRSTPGRRFPARTRAPALGHRADQPDHPDWPRWREPRTTTPAAQPQILEHPFDSRSSDTHRVLGTDCSNQAPNYCSLSPERSDTAAAVGASADSGEL